MSIKKDTIERLREAIRYVKHNKSFNIKNQDDFAKELNVDIYKIRNMLGGSVDIKPEFALDLRDKFGIDPCWLIFGTGVMNAKFNLDGYESEVLSNTEITSMLNDLKEKIEKLESNI